MKTKWILIALTLLTMATAMAQGKTRPVVPMKVDGKESGGGGGTLPANPTGADFIREFVMEAKAELILFYNLSETFVFQKNHEPSSLEKKIYLSRPNLYDKIIGTDIQINYDGPCFDREGRAMDASIYADKPNTICLSAYTIGPKLNLERARAEVTALIGHELSHLLGTTETEAVHLQQSIAFNFGATGIMEFVPTFMYLRELKSKGEGLQRTWHELVTHLEKWDEKTIGQKVDQILREQSKFEEMAGKLPRSLLNRQEVEYNAVQSLQLLYLHLYFLLRENPNNKYYNDILKEDFRGKKEITYSQYMRAKPERVGYSPNRYGKEILVRPSNLAEAKVIIKKLDDYFTTVAWRPQELQLQYTPRILAPSVEKGSPFAPFLGSYDVKSVVCSQSENGRGHLKFEVQQISNGQYVLRYSGNGYSGHYAHLYDGALDPMGGYAKVLNLNGKAIYQAELGNRWGSLVDNNPFRHKTITMQRAGSQVLLTEEWLSRKEELNFQPTFRSRFVDSISTCTYTLNLVK